MASELLPVADNLEYDVTLQGLAVRQQVFGRYTLRHVLGRGGMGVVWLAQDERLEREVALKFLPESVNGNPGAVDDLKRETRRCLDLTHPNIIRIYDFIHEGQTAAISMEYIDGKTLAALRVEKEQRVFEVEELRKWVPQICRALHYAHEEVEIVHRDLKPANLMVTSRGQIKIADFGIARSVSDSLSHVTMSTASSGTLAYMSPQQLNGEMASVTDDIYALGATLYELLTGKPPFYSGDIPYQARALAPLSMAERRREFGITGQAIPPEWEAGVAACLAKAADQRPRSMNALAERLSAGTPSRRMVPLAQALSPAQAEVAPSKRPATPPPLPRSRWSVELPLLVAGAGLALLLVGWIIWQVMLGPLFLKPGQLLVTSTPAGAKVQLPGVADQSTPATFASLHPGSYQMTVSEPGYDPVVQTINVKAGAKLNLGSLQLKRAFGQLNLTSQPPHVHYTLTGGADAGNLQREGTTPDILPALPSGVYQLVLNNPGFPAYTGTIEIPEHATKAETADLIQLAVAADASPGPAKVLRGEMSAAQLDDLGRNELLDLYNRAFQEYLSYGVLASAASQLEKLKDLGRNTEAQEAQLAQKRSATEKDVADQISALMQQNKFATAAAKLDNAGGMLEKDSVDRLQAEFQVALTHYQQQIELTIKVSQAAPSLIGYHQLKTIAAQYPDDSHVQLALAQIQTQMPPDAERLASQLKTFRQLGAQDRDFAADPTFLSLQATFNDEFNQLNALTKALNAAQEGSSTTTGQISRLKAQKLALEKRQVGKPKSNPFAQAVNFFGKAFVGHAVVDNQAYFSSEDAKEDAIANVEAKIEAAEGPQQPQGAVAEAQQRYNDFLARVPWGPGTPAPMEAPSAAISKPSAVPSS